MTEAEARARLILFADATVEPVLASEEIDILLNMSKEVDRYKVLPTDTGWTETYNVNTAIALAWLVKAGRLAPRYLFMSGGKMLSRQQFYDHCMTLHKRYAMKAGIRAVRLGSSPLGLAVVPNNANA